MHYVRLFLGSGGIENAMVTGQDAAAKQAFATADAALDRTVKIQKRPDMSWQDHLVMLLNIGAEIEHGLMVMYLYAAYSLGGEQVPKEHRAMVNRWQNSILAVAKEEMGHLLTVQNVLTLLGARINLERRNFPWDTEYYPFDFKLEPLTLKSLSCYIFAEMPSQDDFVTKPGKKIPKRFEHFAKEDLAEIVKEARESVLEGKPHPVSVIYDEIIKVISDPVAIPDSVFNEDSFPYQASWDDWGRGYRFRPKMLDADGSRSQNDKPKAETRAPVVLIERMATRTEVVAALVRISAQGEAMHLQIDQTGEPSHFDRFVEIYDQFKKVAAKEMLAARHFSPSRRVPINPSTMQFDGNTDGDKRGNKDGKNLGKSKSGYIDYWQSRHWGQLFNLRYRILLTYLSHTFRLAYSDKAGEPGLRGMVMHKVFGEMYNLKTIAGLLTAMPLRDAGTPDDPDNLDRAGPPFEMPYSTQLPVSEIDTWRLHLDLLTSAKKVCEMLHEKGNSNSGPGNAYLETLMALDCQSMTWIERIIAGAGTDERQRNQ